jgi:predicted nucleotidyltransferase
MKKNSVDSVFKFTNTQKALSFLAENAGKEFSSSEIQKSTSISKAGVYLTLTELVRCELVLKIKKGSIFLFTVNYDNPLIKQFKVLLNIIRLNPVLNAIKGLSMKIMLYGSAGRGEDSLDSDIDLFIVSKDPEATKDKLSKVKLNRKLQTVVKTPSEIPEFKVKEKVYYEEVSRGITLWEAKE